MIEIQDWIIEEDMVTPDKWTLYQREDLEDGKLIMEQWMRVSQVIDHYRLNIQ